MTDAYEDDNARRSEIFDLLDEGFKRLSQIEQDIHDVMADSQNSDPASKALKSAMDSVDPEKQLALVKRSRAGLKLVKAKLEIDEFSSRDLLEIIRTLEDIKTLGRQLVEGSMAFRRHLRTTAENN